MVLEICYLFYENKILDEGYHHSENSKPCFVYDIRKILITPVNESLYSFAVIAQVEWIFF